jgi:hypothetical protein
MRASPPLCVVSATDAAPAVSSNRSDEDTRIEQHLYASCLVYVKRSILSTDLRSSTGTDRRENCEDLSARLTGCRHFVNMPETRRVGAQPNQKDIA